MLYHIVWPGRGAVHRHPCGQANSPGWHSDSAATERCWQYGCGTATDSHRLSHLFPAASRRLPGVLLRSDSQAQVRPISNHISPLSASPFFVLSGKPPCAAEYCATCATRAVCSVYCISYVMLPGRDMKNKSFEIFVWRCILLFVLLFVGRCYPLTETTNVCCF